LALGAHSVRLERDQQDCLSQATVELLRRQQERDRCERECVHALQACREARWALESRHSQIGDGTIRRALPCLRELQCHQSTLVAEQVQITELSEFLRRAKATYTQTVRELECISVAVHDARRCHAQVGLDAPRRRDVRRDEASPEETPEQAPEATPEEATACQPSAQEQAGVLARSEKQEEGEEEEAHKVDVTDGVVSMEVSCAQRAFTQDKGPCATLRRRSQVGKTCTELGGG